ncbi:MAG: DUF3418 domain-containing protein [Kiritimatiellaeota bacterium]|nr:DUF3418 domain-containing protein [Kiritimatiellota bacterium]
MSKPDTSTSPLPILAHKDAILAAIRAHRAVVVRGETGSGKTTQIPQFCLELDPPGMIACTQPRRIAAVTVAERVAVELGGNNRDNCHRVGWQHRFSSHIPHGARIKFMTDGILLAEISADPLLRKYSVVMVDEAHERSLNIDFILGCLKRALPKRPDLKIIVSSATIEAGRFAEFFGSDTPVIDIPGRLFPIETRWRTMDDDDDLDQAVAQCVDEITAESTTGDILVFLPGERDIRATADTLNSQLSTYNSQLSIIPLMASLPPAEQRRAFQTIPGTRRIVLATNVAETSVTIPGIRYVIDSGLARISRYDSRSRVKRLHIEEISQASAEQRKGRCGRIGPGICYRLYPEEEFVKRPSQNDPEIKRSSLSGLILSMLDWRLGDISDFPFIQPPPSAMVKEGRKELLELQAIAENVDGKFNITELGRRMVRLPLDPRLARMLMCSGGPVVRQADGSLPYTGVPSAATFSILNSPFSISDLLTVVSALSCEDPLARPAEKLELANAAHNKFKDNKSDFAGIIKLWRSLHPATPMSRNATRKFCKENFISYRRLLEWEDVREQLERSLKTHRISNNGKSEKSEKTDIVLHKALMTGLLPNIGVYDPDEKQYRGANGTRFSIFPGSGLRNKTPKWLVCAELIETSRLFARRCAEIQPEWIAETAAHLVKHTYRGEFWDERAGTARALRDTVLFGLMLTQGARCDISRSHPAMAREIFIREGLVGGKFPAPVPEFVAKNLAFIGKQIAAAHRTRTIIPENANDEFFALYDSRLPAECVNAPALRKWLKHAKHDEINALFFKEEDLLSPADASSGFPEKIGKLKLRYRHNPQADDDGISCVLTADQIPLALAWHSDRLVPGALPGKIEAMLKMLTRNQQAASAAAVGAFGAVKGSRELAAVVCKAVEGWIEPLAVAVSKFVRRVTGKKIVVLPDFWDDAALPERFSVRFVITDKKGDEIFATRNKSELAEFGEEYARCSGVAVQRLADHRSAATILALRSNAATHSDAVIHALELATRLPAESAHDIATQMGRLFYPGYENDVPPDKMANLPRYVSAAMTRIERGQNSPANDLKKLAILAPILRRHYEMAVSPERVLIDETAFAEHRWLIEELRVSLFAQELKTPFPVSIKKLDEVWARV